MTRTTLCTAAGLVATVVFAVWITVESQSRVGHAKRLSVTSAEMDSVRGGSCITDDVDKKNCPPGWQVDGCDCNQNTHLCTVDNNGLNFKDANSNHTIDVTQCESAYQGLTECGLPTTNAYCYYSFTCEEDCVFWLPTFSWICVPDQATYVNHAPFEETHASGDFCSTAANEDAPRINGKMVTVASINGLGLHLFP